MNKDRSRRINQADVAREAGVSISTVSRALGDASGIGVEVRDKVRRLAVELGYEDRGRMRSGAAVVYLPMHPVTGSLHQFYEEVLSGIRSEADGLGITLHPRLLPERAIDLPLVRREAEKAGSRAALMLFFEPKPDVARFFAEEGALVTILHADEHMRFDAVLAQDFLGTLMATRTVLAHGHRSLLFVEGHLRISARERRRGFEAAVAEVPGARGEVMYIGPDRPEIAEESLERRFAEGNRGDWTAVVCMNDLIAIGVMQALHHRGFAVPDDISVMGFDDMPWASMTTPRLSTMRLDREELGRQGIRLVQRRFVNPSAPPLSIGVGLSPVAGGTVAMAATPNG